MAGALGATFELAADGVAADDLAQVLEHLGDLPGAL
jgi:hypothetical protein